MREKIIDGVAAEKLIVIVRGVEKEKICPLTDALINGGIRFMEVTYDTSGKIPDTETADKIRLIADKFHDKMFVGAGTVTTVEQVEMTAKAGGKFIISPNTNVAVIKKTRECGLVSMPGALTPSEIRTAADNGADYVKVFPASVLGPDYIRSVKAPLSDVKLLAVGGIKLENIKSYMDCGVCGFGIGANVINKQMLDKNDFEGIEKLAAEYVKLVKQG